MLTKVNFISEIEKIMRDLKFPAEAVESLVKDASALLLNDVACARFFDVVRQYDESVEIDYVGAQELVKELAPEVGVHEYALMMLHYLSLCPRLRERYAERGLSDKLFVDTMQDLCFKVKESKIVHGVWGTFVAFWFPRFFSAIDRFFFVRLQLEPKPLEYDCVIDGVEYKKGAKVLNVHIPRTETPLLHDEAVESYKAAVEFFKDYYGDGPRLIVCNSWLLFTKHNEILKPDSNIRLFAEDYAVVKEWTQDNPPWSVFGKIYTGNPDDMPADNTLRKAYVAFLKNGEKAGGSYGVFNFDEQVKKWAKS